MARGKEDSRVGEQERPEAADDVRTASEAQPDASSDAPSSAEAEVEALREKLLRAQADYQNLRRRSLEDRTLEVRRTLMPLFSELLFVLDYLDMALAAPTTTEEAKNLAAGVDMTRARLLQALESAGVTPIGATGTFDPERHEASTTEVAPGVVPGTILRVVRRGFAWNETVLRHAQVVVAAEPGAEPGRAR